LTVIATKNADNCYSRRENFGGSLVHNMALTDSLDGTKVYGEEFEGKGSV